MEQATYALGMSHAVPDARPALLQLLWREAWVQPSVFSRGLHPGKLTHGYNLAVEYLAAYEKGWMLDSFRALSDKTLAKNGRNVRPIVQGCITGHRCSGWPCFVRRLRS
eukprot:scaffold1124_cov361-Prasinococcus_capsulatus_cf.AAC.15